MSDYEDIYPWYEHYDEPVQSAVKELVKNNWCDCKDRDLSEVFYHEDYDTPLSTCVEKHHWHCDNCNGLVQVG